MLYIYINIIFVFFSKKKIVMIKGGGVEWSAVKLPPLISYSSPIPLRKEESVVVSEEDDFFAKLSLLLFFDCPSN
jgi:hypothetical protein